MTDIDNYDPADELRQDIESAISEQEKGGEREPEPVEQVESEDAEQPEAVAGERERDEKGRFKAADGVEKPAEESKLEAKAEPASEEVAKTEIKPPPGFSVAAKACWEYEDLTTEEWNTVKADIVKREQEVDNGFKRYAGLGKFAEEAERNGTSLQSAVTDYVAIENSLKANFVGGVEFICQRLGVDPQRLAQVMAQRYRVAAPAPANAGQSASPAQPAQPAFDQQELMRQFQQIAQQTARAEADARVQAMREETQRATIDSQIEAFGSDPKNKFFPNLRQDMAALVQAGKANTLKEAYEAASWLNPETRAILINETNGGRDRAAAGAVSRARNAAKAVGGSPAPGAAPDAKGRRTDMSLDDEIRAAVDAQMGQI